MPGVPSLANTWKVTIKQHQGSEDIENVIHVTAPIPGVPQDIANAVGAAWTVAGSIQDNQSNQLFYDNIAVQPYDGASAPYDLPVTGFTGLTGGAAFVPSSVQTSWIITLRTLTSGRSYRGRMYIAGLPTVYTSNDGTQWNSTRASLHQSIADKFFTELELSPNIDALVVYSQKLNTKTPVSAVVSRQYLGTQRRRTR